MYYNLLLLAGLQTGTHLTSLFSYLCPSVKNASQYTGTHLTSLFSCPCPSVPVKHVFARIHTRKPPHLGRGLSGDYRETTGTHWDAGTRP
jgi:hypothetical protein